MDGVTSRMLLQVTSRTILPVTSRILFLGSVIAPHYHISRFLPAQESFARASASCSLVNVMHDNTGPKISSLPPKNFSRRSQFHSLLQRFQSTDAMLHCIPPLHATFFTPLQEEKIRKNMQLHGRHPTTSLSS